MRDDGLLKAALYHHGLGRKVVDIHLPKKDTSTKWGVWRNRAQSEEEVRKLFSNGAQGLAILAWPYTEFIVLDFDGPHSQQAWEQIGIALPDTARNITMSGGFHLIYKAPAAMDIDHVKRTVRLVKTDCRCTKNGRPKPCGVDLLLNGYFVIPPTNGYQEDANNPFDHFTELPQEVISLAQAKQNHRSESSGAGKISQGERNNTLASLGGSMRRRGMTEEGISAALLTENESRCDPPLPDREVAAIVRSIGRYAPSENGGTEHLTDLGNAKRLVSMHGQDLHFCHQLGWVCWDGTRWQKDETGEVVRRAKDTVCSIYAEAAQSSDMNTRKALGSHAKRSEAEARIKAMISLAESEIRIPVTVDELDSNPWTLNVLNGTIDLRTGDLRPHRREDLITKLVPVTYDPEASCPRWDEFLKCIMNVDEGLIRFVQRTIGYSLTGDSSEQVIFIFHGIGANGKTTFINVVTSMLADYSRQTPTETLLVKRGGTIPNDVARLAGARFVAAVESEGGKRLAEALVKQLTGGDTITARFLHREFFEFRPTFKLFLAVNHKPRISGTDHAIWRRIKIVPFTVTIPEESQDKALTEKLRGELPGILRWAVEGCLDWQREGLGIPKAVTQATASYREEMDLMGDFLADCCETDPNATATAKELMRRMASGVSRMGRNR